MAALRSVRGDSNPAGALDRSRAHSLPRHVRHMRSHWEENEAAVSSCPAMWRLRSALQRCAQAFGNRHRNGGREGLPAVFVPLS